MGKAKYIPPSQAELELKALNFYKKHRPKEYQRLETNHELKVACHLKAENAIRYAQDLIASGVLEVEAWDLAIRSKILESEND